MVEKAADKDVIQALRTVHQNQTQLNLMADQKANILIGTLVLVFTVVLTQLMTVADQPFQYLMPIAILLFCEMVALILTTLVLLPKNINGHIGKGKATDIAHMLNPFFFGFFTRYSESEYQDFLAQHLVDDDSAHKLLISDIYQTGVILKRKYTLLRWAYLFALAGIALALVAGLMLMIQIGV